LLIVEFCIPDRKLELSFISLFIYAIVRWPIYWNSSEILLTNKEATTNFQGKKLRQINCSKYF